MVNKGEAQLRMLMNNSDYDSFQSNISSDDCDLPSF